MSPDGKFLYVGRQYLGSIGKIDNGIVAVTSLWADEHVYYPLHVRPYTTAKRLPKGQHDPGFRTKPQLAEALVETVVEAGGSVLAGQEVTRVVVEGRRAVGVETAAGVHLRARRAVLADTAPLHLFAELVGEGRVPVGYLDGLRRFRYGSGIFKLDLALDGPAPWEGDELDRCGVIHVTGDLDNMSRSANEVRRRPLPTESALVREVSLPLESHGHASPCA